MVEEDAAVARVDGSPAAAAAVSNNSIGRAEGRRCGDEAGGGGGVEAGAEGAIEAVAEEA